MLIMKKSTFSTRKLLPFFGALLITAWFAACDLAIVSVWNVSTQASTGDVFTVAMTVENVDEGNYNIGSLVSFQYYLSYDGLVGEDDILLGTDWKPNPLYLEQVSDTQQVAIPSNVVSGNYYFLYHVTWNQFDMNANSNTVAKPIYVFGQANNDQDLIFKGFTQPVSNGVSGKEFSLSYNVQNFGNVAAGSSTVKYYISDDQSLDTGQDLFLGEKAVPALGAQASKLITENLYLPINLWQGYYFIYAVLDANNEIAESNETNNIVSRQVYLFNPFKAPQIIGNPEASNSFAGGKITVEHRWTASRDRNYEALTTGYVLSTDRYLDASDRWLGTSEELEVNDGASRSQRTDLAIPADTPPGDYWLLFVASEDLPSYIHTPGQQPPATRFRVMDYPAANSLKVQEQESILSVSPNPVIGSARAKYDLKGEAPYRLLVYDTQGREVKRLAEGVSIEGTHEVTFDTAYLPAGVYQLVLVEGDNSTRQALVVN